MAREKLKKQDLRLKENEFLTWTMQAETWLAQNYQMLIGMVVVALALFAAVSFFKSRRARVIAEDNAAYAVAQTYTYTIPYYVGEELQTQRDQIVSEANTKINDLIGKAGTKPLGRSALFLKASLHYEMREYDSAISAATNFLNIAATSEERAKGNLLLGYCFESKVNDELMKPSGVDQLQADAWRAQAAEAFQKAAAAAKGTYLEYEALMCQARVLDMQGKYADSLALLDRVKSERNWFDEYYKKAAKYDSELPIASFLKSLEEGQRFMTFHELASLYEKRLEGLTAKSQ